MSNESSDLLRALREHSISRRTLLGSLFFSALASTTVGRALGVGEPVITQILGRPTNTSVAVSLLASEKVTAYIEYGYSKSKYTGKSSQVTLLAGVPQVLELNSLKPNSRLYYRLRFAVTGSKTLQAGKQYSFNTQRAQGSPFAFSVQGDTHPERAGKMFNSDLYYVTMANIAAQQPDFHILLGDDFSIDPLIDRGAANQANVEKIYGTHRNWLAVAGSSVPIFLVNGNHEQAAGYLLDGTKSSPAVLAGNARLKYFALPAPNSFYSGDLEEIPEVGLPRDYYSWNWGDALFITLDPYWHSKYAVDNVAGNSDGSAKVKDLWKVGIGDEQYAWLKKTLENSSAKYKFIFAHHVLGTGRGGVEVSTTYEWGGTDPKGISTFAKERPNWELPIHDLMVKHGVSVFFQGHDHIFVHQERDGVVYQSMPNPADDTFSMFNDSAYKTGAKAPNSGHVRVSVSPSEAKVEYFLAARAKDLGRKNLELAHAYVIKPYLK